MTPAEQAALTNLDTDRADLVGEETQIQSQLDRLYGQEQRQQKVTGEAESDLEGIGVNARRRCHLLSTRRRPSQTRRRCRLAPLLLISAFGGKAMGLNAGNMLAATNGMVGGYLSGKQEQFADATKQYQQAFEAFKQRKADMDKMYATFQEAYKGRLDYQQKALDATIKTMGEENAKRRMTVQGKINIDKASAQLEAHNKALNDSNYYKEAELKIKQKRRLRIWPV